MSQVKGQVIRQRQDRKCPWAAILITKISVADNRLGISSQWLDVGDACQSGKLGTLLNSLFFEFNI